MFDLLFIVALTVLLFVRFGSYLKFFILLVETMHCVRGACGACGACKYKKTLHRRSNSL